MDDTLVLCYHALSPDWPEPLSIVPGAFEEQVDFILSRGYRAATFTEAVTTPRHGRLVAFTFDDGYHSVVERAVPALSSRGIPATVFVPTDFVGTSRLAWPTLDRWLTGPYESELRPISWDDARALVALGWEIGSHTATHARLTDLDERRLRLELGESRRACEEQLDAPCRSLAYPYGAVNERVVAAAAAAGYRAAAALPGRLHRSHMLEWPRIGVFSGDSLWRFRAKVGATRRWLIGRGPGEAMLRVQKRLG